MDFASACSDFVRWARGGDRPVIPFDRSDRIKAQERASNTACEVVSSVSCFIDMDGPTEFMAQFGAQVFAFQSDIEGNGVGPHASI
jgi:hypothetical protein